MPSKDDQFVKLAAEAAERIDRQVELGQQLTLLPDAPVPEAVDRKAGRPAGAKNKGSSQMREWLASRGYQMPEDVLVQMAGMASSHDVFTFAMVQAERMLSWAGDGAKNVIWAGPADGHKVLDGPWQPSPADKIEAFKFCYQAALRAAEALLPYGASKMTPEVNVNQNTTVIVPAAPSSTPPGTDARVVNAPKGRRMMPADVAQEIEQNQDVTNSESDQSDRQIRTE
ncbi:MAG: hypothetical protein AAFU41_00760 [Pseudomonadota bacterium]